MPTLEHNGLIELFRDNPRLAPHLLELLFHLKLPSYASVEVAEAALDQLIPVEFRADLVLELRDAAGTVVLAVVLLAGLSHGRARSKGLPHGRARRHAG